MIYSASRFDAEESERRAYVEARRDAAVRSMANDLLNGVPCWDRHASGEIYGVAFRMINAAIGLAFKELRK